MYGKIKLKFIPDVNIPNGLVVYSKHLINDICDGIAYTDIIKGQDIYSLPDKVRNKYKVYLRTKL